MTIRRLVKLAGIDGPGGGLLRRLYKEFWDDDVLGLASQCAFALIFSLFPFLIFLVSLAAFLPTNGDAHLPPELTREMPPPVADILQDRIAEVTGRDRTGALTVALLIAIWSATAGASTLVSAINRAYDVEERRGFLLRRAIGLALIAAGAVLMLLPAIWGWFGGIATDLLARFGMSQAAGLVDWLRWPVILVGAFAWLALLFRVAPEGTKRWRFASPGAFVAALGFLAANRGLSLYVENAGDMSVTYGALGGFVVLLLWLYVVSLVLLLGAEVNAVLDARRAPLLPPRRRQVAPEHLPPVGGRKPVRT